MFIMNLNQWDLGLELNILYNMIKEIAAEYNSIYQTIDYDK